VSRFTVTSATGLFAQLVAHGWPGETPVGEAGVAIANLCTGSETVPLSGGSEP